MLTTTYAPLDAGRPGWGKVAVLPWDSDHFGFNVGDYAPGEAGEVAADAAAFSQALAAWAARERVELVSARADSGDGRWRLLLDRLGFDFIDCSLDVELRGLRTAEFPEPAHPVRRAQPQDADELMRIAERAFERDRYSADPRFPGRLAQVRHRRWMQTIVASRDPGARTYVTGEPGRPTGFVSLVRQADVAALILAAVDPEVHAKGLGTSLFRGMLRASAAEGATVCTGKLYSANYPIMNIFAHLQFRFTRSLALFHWHAAAAPHLVPLEDVLK
jgi:ribosomal protein S18 acetylase RimI-like enzyme